MSEPAVRSGWAVRGERPRRQEHAQNVNVGVFPTLSFHAGVSMTFYASRVMLSLEEVPGVRARLLNPPWAAVAHTGWMRNRWIRYFRYPVWARSQAAQVYHVLDHGNAQLLLALRRDRVVVTCHDLYPLSVALGKLRFPGVEKRAAMVASALRLQLVRSAAAVICISQHTLEECRTSLGIPPRRLYVARLPVDGAFRHPCRHGTAGGCREELGLREDDVAVLHVGGEEPRKNVGTVLRVVARLRERVGKRVKLLKVGAKLGPRNQEIVASLDLGDVVKQLGMVSTERLACIYRASTALLYPSFHEGFAWPVLEAMASGLPVVASNWGAIPEVAAGAAALYDPQDVAGMAGAIYALSQSASLRDEMIKAGRETSARFTVRAHGEALAEVYRAVAAS